MVIDLGQVFRVSIIYGSIYWHVKHSILNLIFRLDIWHLKQKM